MRCKVVTVLALLLLVLAVPAKAALITQTYTFSGLPNFGESVDLQSIQRQRPLGLHHN